jgi:Fe-S-cluster containining protein
VDQGTVVPGTGLSADSYGSRLRQLDEWFAVGRRTAPGRVPCRDGCTACCHGPFDISVADAELLTDAVGRLPAAERATVIARAAALLDRMRAIEHGWTPPYDVAAIGEHRFDQLTDALAGEPCPLLDDAGRCRIYADRPLVCRLIGLGMATPAGRVIENACPIQDRFPGYRDLPPVPFALEAFEELEVESLRAAAVRRFGDAERWAFETTIAAAVVAGAAEHG